MFAKFVHLTGLVVLSLSVGRYVVAGSSAGGIVSVDKKPFYASPRSDKTIKVSASPVLLTGLALGGRRQVIAVNGQVAWVDDPNEILAMVQLKPRTKALELTANSTESNPTPDRKWISIEHDLKLRITGATRKTYTFTPAYIKDQGRANLLPEQWSPYQLPEVQLKSANISGWTGILGLDVITDEKLDRGIFYGILIRPFLGMLDIDYQEFQPNKPIRIKNFSYAEPQATRLSSVSWQLESMLIIPPNTNSGLGIVGLASDIKRQSYLLTLLWKNKRVSYLGFSGVTDNSVERIPTPVLVNYEIRDINDDGVDDVRLDIGQITGDDAYIDSIQIDGKYSIVKDGVKLLSK